MRGERTTPVLEGIHAVAQQLGLRLHVADARMEGELAPAFGAMRQQGSQAVFVGGDAYFWGLENPIAALALNSRLPSSFAFASSVEVGGLMSYGVDGLDSWRRLATYVDKVFKGAKPGDIPIEQPTKFELTVNRSTADALGLDIPQALLLQAAKLF